MLGPPSFLARGRELSANLLFLYLLRTSAGLVTPPERPAWARGFGDVAFHKDRTGMKATSGAASASAHHDPGHLFARAPFGRGGPQGHSTNPSVSTAPGTTAGHHPTTATSAASAKAASYAGSNTLVAPPQVCIRTARREDIPYIEACNLETLPENYPNAFYHNHLLQWPYLALVAERKPLAGEHDRNSNGNDDGGKKIVGYVLGRVEVSNNNNGGQPHQDAAFEPVPQDYLPGVVMPSSSSSSLQRQGGGNSAPFLSTTRKTGHVSSLAVLEEYRRLGIARELMEILHVQMKFRYGVDCSTLHVRCSNRGAQKLYVNTLEYKIVETVQRYYQDGADAYYMKLDFNPQEDDVRQRATATSAMGGGGGRVVGSSSSSSTGFTVREKESALLTQDAQGYFNLYPSSSGGGGAAAASSSNRANA